MKKRTSNTGLLFTGMAVLAVVGLSYLYSVKTTETAELSIQPDVIPTEKLELAPEQSYLTDTQLRHYMEQVRLSNFTSNPAFGTTFLAVDWNSVETANPLDIPTSLADSGRKIALGFDNTIAWGSRWGGVGIHYSTYDFGIGAEHDMYAEASDLVAIKNNTVETITVNGVEGIVRYSQHSMFNVIQKVVVFPFADYYIATVYHFTEPVENPDAVLADLQKGIYPEKEAENLRNFDELTASLQFLDAQ